MVDPLTFGVIALIYIIVILWLGYLGYKKTVAEEDFLVAGRKIHPMILALSYGATFISTSAIVGFGGVAANLGMGLIWLTVLNIGIGILLAFIIFGKRIREIGQRLKAVTFPDLLGKSYDSSFMQSVTSILLLVGMPLYTAAILIGGARFIETTLSIPYDIALVGFVLIVAIYVILGGLIAVMYTDAVQGAIMLIGMTILLIFTYILLGGVNASHAELSGMASLVPSNLAAGGMTGWTEMPLFGSSIWLTMITTIVLGVGIGVLAQPQLVVRFMTVKDNRSINRAIFIGGPFILMMTGVAFTVGALTNVYFYREQGVVAVQAAGGNIDSIIPLFINSAMPEVFVVVFMLALLAAAMSTLSSLFHTMGTSAGYDLWCHMKGCRPVVSLRQRLVLMGVLSSPGGDSITKASFRPSQLGTALMIVVSVILAYMMPGSIIARATAMFFGLCAAAFLPALTHALYSKRPCTIAAKWSLVVGALTWFLWTVFVHAAESKPLGIANLLFGRDSLLAMPWQAVNPLVIGLPLSTIALIVVWYLDKRTRVEG